MKHNKKIFTRKPSRGDNLYKWSPDANQITKAKIAKQFNDFFCTAIPGSQGEDRITTYVYDSVIVNGEVKKLAYVECDYVE